MAFEFPDGPYPQPFNVELDDSFLEMTLRKVRDYRPTFGLSDQWTIEGPPSRALIDVADYWSTKYSWRSVERKMNDDFNHFATTVPGSDEYTDPISFHYIHQRSPTHNAIPLLLLHGWPSTLLEWSKVVRPLGEHLEQSFDIVAPDLPGFGLSPAPKRSGLGPRALARALDALMLQLGYEKYGIVTTDIGWFIGMWMVNEVKDSIIGHMTDFFIAPPTPGDRALQAKGEASTEESAYIASYDSWFESHWAYATVHAQKPLALSQALGDSPVGLLGWYWDVNNSTSDGFEYSFEQLITDAMMLWIPGPYANCRAYLEFFKPDVMDFPPSRVPTGVSEWGWSKGPFSKIGDFAFAPMEWVKRTTNLVYFNKHDEGGHFPAICQPDLWVQDVRTFFGQLKESGI
ncbi:hypothetical protein M441DRAFT_154975 [Trichoderma asperellum CBS 433.97]|uniref:Epoxide hydrolase N-terminal domain-containing protein n=2 Tax=Trichoderma asperellum TaxID=101201 RepID=A0A2T3YQ90_TRIA4|nr:hypothetical protein M441DRAFT_154975 [Trichoderma asperellum CBS 433.97]PTB34743.1 hypothetical protein M441DRAFT_154975 [Trichoderma asperellum CBS 433.97]